MKIAICCETGNADGLVSVNFKKAEYLLLVDTEKESIYEVIKKNDEENLLFAARMVDENCEDVITGPDRKSVM